MGRWPVVTRCGRSVGPLSGWPYGAQLDPSTRKSQHYGSIAVTLAHLREDVGARILASGQCAAARTVRDIELEALGAWRDGDEGHGPVLALAAGDLAGPAAEIEQGPDALPPN